jgi:hypothetical protein
MDGAGRWFWLAAMASFVVGVLLLMNPMLYSRRECVNRALQRRKLDELSRIYGREVCGGDGGAGELGKVQLFSGEAWSNLKSSR